MGRKQPKPIKWSHTLAARVDKAAKIKYLGSHGWRAFRATVDEAIKCANTHKKTDNAEMPADKQILVAQYMLLVGHKAPLPSGLRMIAAAANLKLVHEKGLAQTRAEAGEASSAKRVEATNGAQGSDQLNAWVRRIEWMSDVGEEQVGKLKSALEGNSIDAAAEQLGGLADVAV